MPSILDLTSARKRAVRAGLAIDALLDAGVEVREQDREPLRRAVAILEGMVDRIDEGLQGVAGADDYP